MKNIFQPARGTLLPVVLFVFIAVSLMFIDHRSRNLEPLRVGISVLISPLRQLISLPPQAGRPEPLSPADPAQQGQSR